MENKFKDKNRRSSERREVAFTLIYGVDRPFTLRVSLGLASDVDALMQNLSESGMAIVTEFNIPEETQLHIKFNLMNLFLTGEKRSRRMDIIGRTVSNADLGNDNYRIGVFFDKIAQDDQEAIKDFVKRSKMSF